MTSPAVDTGIVAFIEARLNEREKAAREEIALAERAYPGDEFDIEYRWARITSHRTSGGGGSSLGYGAPTPIEVVAGVAKDRAILALHRPDAEDVTWGVERTFCSVCTYDDGLDRESYPCQTVRLLAAIDADHPDFDPSWKPVAG